MKEIEYTNNIYGILWVKLKRQKGMRTISLSTRQKRIAEIVRQDGPITGEHIAERLNVTRAICSLCRLPSTTIRVLTKRL